MPLYTNPDLAQRRFCIEASEKGATGGPKRGPYFFFRAPPLGASLHALSGLPQRGHALVRKFFSRDFFEMGLGKIQKFFSGIFRELLGFCKNEEG